MLSEFFSAVKKCLGLNTYEHRKSKREYMEAQVVYFYLRDEVGLQKCECREASRRYLNYSEREREKMIHLFGFDDIQDMSFGRR